MKKIIGLDVGFGNTKATWSNPGSEDFKASMIKVHALRG